MGKDFRELFSLHFHHRYYRDGKTDDLFVVPTAETARWMDRHHLRLRPMDGAFRVYYGREDHRHPLLEFLRESKTTPTLTFFIRIKTAAFFQFTDLPEIHFNRYKLYFSNAKVGGPEKEDAGIPLPLTAGSKEQVTEADLLPGLATVLPELATRLPAPESEPAESLELSVQDIDGAPRAGLFLHWDKVQRQWRAQYPDLSGLPSGKYTIPLPEQEPLEFLHLSPALRPADHGLLQIQLGPDPNGNHPFLEGPSIRQQHYVITFNSRSTIWRYHLIQRRNGTDGPIPQRSYSVQKGRDAVFEIEKEETDPAGRERKVTLQSKSALALREVEEHEAYFELNATGGEGPADFTPLTLPLPGKDNVRALRDQENNVTYYSDLYVYL